MKKIINDLKNIEKPILKVMIKGFKFSFLVCLIAFTILIVHNQYPYSHIVYDSGILLFKTGLMFAVEFVICAIATDTIKKQMI